MTRPAAGVLLGAALLAAAVLRFPRLEERPMHGDEAIQAMQASELWRSGRVCYDPKAFHGPVLHYLTLPFLWLSKASSFAETSETDFRAVPAVLGVAMLGLAWLMASGLSPSSRLPAAVAALILAVSPSLAYYSRYYIQEIPLVFFTGLALASLWRYARTRRRAWLYSAAVSAGVMLAAKETALIALCAMAAAWAAAPPARIRLNEMAGPAAAGLAAAALLLSGFLTRPENLNAAFLAPFHYAGLAISGGEHAHAWSYYLGLLALQRTGPGPAFSEAAMLGLAAAGVLFSFRESKKVTALPRFLSLYALFLAVLYSLIPYKTPWCVLSLVFPLALLAGLGAVRIIEAPRRRMIRVALALALGAILAHSIRQAYQAIFVYPSDRRNPYVYAHPVPDAIRLARQVERLARFHPAHSAMPVTVIGADCWPLPWYLRRMTRVGYWERAPEDLNAPVIIHSSETAAGISNRLQGPYETLLYGLRPGRVLEMRVQSGLWNRSIPEIK